MILPVRLKKSLGQHFLRDENICRKIVDAVAEFHPHQLLEIGPGGGAITRYLYQIPGIVFRAVEVDEEKFHFLAANFPEVKKSLILGDFLKMEKPFEGPFSVVGNFPYNISTEILFRLLAWRADIETITCMFQKEVAQRIASPEGNKVYGVVSVLIQAFFTVEYLFDVSEQCFQPPPKVKSGVIRLRPLVQPYDIVNERFFFLLVKTAFNQRRKTLRNALKSILPPDSTADALFDQRAEQLSVHQFVELANRFAAKTHA